VELVDQLQEDKVVDHQVDLEEVFLEEVVDQTQEVSHLLEEQEVVQDLGVEVEQELDPVEVVELQEDQPPVQVGEGQEEVGVNVIYGLK
jgi:hypothetical protein